MHFNRVNRIYLALLLLVPLLAVAEPRSTPVQNVNQADTILLAKSEQETKKVYKRFKKPLVYDRTVQGSMDEVYAKIFTALENNSYYVIFEPNLGKTLSHFAKRWGDDYNKNQLSSIRSMVFCSAWYANKISNEDPGLLALCPMRITLYSKDNETHILFVRPSKVAGDSPARTTAKELEDDVIRTIEVAISH